MKKLTEKLRGKPLLKWVGYPLFFNFAFMAGMQLTFPGEALRDRIVQEAKTRMDLNLEIGEVRLAGLTGVTLEDVAIVEETNDIPTPVAEGEGEGEGEEGAPAAPAPSRIQLDSLTAQAELLSLLTGKKAFTFDIEAWGGELSGRVLQGEDERSIKARARGLVLEKSPLKALSGLDLEGKLDELDIDLKSGGKDYSQADGAITIKGEGLTLKGGEVQHFELPRVALGKLGGKIEFVKGEGKLDGFEIDGQDLKATLEGKVKLASKLGSSSIQNGKLKIKPSDEWWNKNEMLKTAANFALPAGSDGWRTLSVYGALSKPGFRPIK